MKSDLMQHFIHKLSPRITSLAVFLICSSFTLPFIGFLNHLHLESVRSETAHEASNFINSFKFAVEKSASAAYAIAVLVKDEHASTEELEKMARILLPSFPGVSDVALAPKDAVDRLCCQESDQHTLDLTVPTNRKASVENQSDFANDQISLVVSADSNQEENGLVARLPIFLRDQLQTEFWGYVNVGLELEKILAVTLSNNRLGGYQYELLRLDPKTGTKQVIASNIKKPLIQPLLSRFDLFDSEWQLNLSRFDGWQDFQFQAMTLIGAILFNTLIACLTFFNLRLNRRGAGLEAQIIADETTLDIARQQLVATFDSIPDLAWLKDQNGVFLNCNRRFESFVGRSKSNIIGRTDYEFVDQELADFFRLNDRKAMAAGQAISNEEWLTFASDGYRGLFETIKTPIPDSFGDIIGILGIARDITEHRQRAEDLKESEIRLTVTLEATGVGIWDWNLITDEWSASPAYFSILGREPIVGAADRKQELEFVHPEDRAGIIKRINNVLQHGQLDYHYEARMRHVDGDYRWVSVRGKVVEKDEQGKPKRLVGVRIDIDDVKKAEEQAYQLAHFDSLTGLPNRVMLINQLNCFLNNTGHDHIPFALLFVDLDQFKNVNDSHGHSVGDQLLQSVARQMRDVIGDKGVVSRQGGDEFVILLPNADSIITAKTAKQLLAALSKPQVIDQFELFITPSIGISMYPADGDNFDTLLKCADVAMYNAKHHGRNNYKFFTPKMQSTVERNALLEAGLRRALQRDELSLCYQPQINIQTKSVTGVEALLRWHHPVLGAISPAEFIPIAEESGLIMPIGEWVLKTAIQQMRRWIEQGVPLENMAVNLSAVQFRHPNLSERIAQILHVEQLEPHYLELELTERVAMDDPQHAIEIMHSLIKQGIKLSIDDFGTGYSSLNYLKRFHVSKLKIDKSFVQKLPEDNDDVAIIAAIISLAKNLGMTILAEGVETLEQLAFLHDKGCEEIQGYYFSPPVAAEKVPELCATIEKNLAEITNCSQLAAVNIS